MARMTQMGNHSDSQAYPRRAPADDDPLDRQDELRLAIGALADAPPERNLWPGIEARLGARTTPARSVQTV